MIAAGLPLESVARIAVTVLINSLWEDAILVVAVWFLLRMSRETNASTRYFSWLVTLIVAVVLPIVTTIPQLSASAHAHFSIQPSPLRQANSLSPKHPRPPRAGAVPRSSAPVQATPFIPFRFPSRLYVALPAWFASSFFSLWAIVALAIGARLAFDLYRLERLKRDSLPLPLDVRDQMERWLGAAYGRRRDVRICVSDKIEIPVAVGIFDSLILLPQHLLDQFSAGEIDSISLHELAHLRRHDDVANAFQRLAQTVFFFNPAVRYIASQLDLEREVACDDWVLSLTGDVRPYATCLTKMAELTAWPQTPLAAPGVFVTRKGISVRIERLLNKHRNARAQMGVGVPLAVTAMLVAFFVLVDVVAPTFAFKEESAATTMGGVTHKMSKARTASRLRWIAMPRPASSPAATPAAPRKNIAPVSQKAITQYINRTILVPRVAVRPHPIHPRFSPVRANRPVPQAALVPPINVHVPEINVRVPGTDVHVPAIDVHVPSTRLHVGVPSRLARGDYSCSGCDFSNVNWPGKDLSHRSFTGSDFSGANLAHANFTGSHLSGVDFSHANLAGANFTDADLSGADLSLAILSGANFSGAHLSGLNGLNPAELDPVQARMLLNKCSGCDFSHVNLHGMDLHGIYLSGIDLVKSDLRGANLQDANFSGVDLSGALLQGASLRGAHFSGCDFSRTDLRNVDLTGVSFNGSDLREAIMK